jgi:hypothetical protein
MLPEVTVTGNGMRNASARMNLQIGKEWRLSSSEAQDDGGGVQRTPYAHRSSSRGQGKEHTNRGV